MMCRDVNVRGRLNLEFVEKPEIIYGFIPRNHRIRLYNLSIILRLLIYFTMSPYLRRFCKTIHIALKYSNS
jgi:hypothetical protein